VDPLLIDAEALAAGQRLARELEKNSLIERSSHSRC
jgi:hypothetical protein